MSTWIRTRSNLCYLSRLSGITADFVDDETLPAGPGQFRTVIVPAAYVLSQETAERLARFARGGGTIILAGASGVVDPWLNKYANVGGAAWTELGWIAGSFRAEPASVDFLPGKAFPPGTAKSKPFRRREHRHHARRRAAPRRPGQRGRLDAAVGTRKTRGLRHPPRRRPLWGQFPSFAPANRLDQATHHRRRTATERGWTSSQTIENRSDKHGEGEPIVEVVVRVRQGRESQEKFVFVLNRGGVGSGLVEVPLAGGDWQASDALSGVPLAGALADGVWRLDLAMKPWEYRVFHLSRWGGRL